MISEEALARTFSPISYSDGFESVKDYRRVQEWASRNPDSGSTACASALDLPRGRVRPWLDGRRPDPVRAIETADSLGWLDADTTNTTGRAFLILSAAVLSGGSITTETYVPRFAVDDERATEQVETALRVLGCGSKLVNEEVPSRATEVEAAEHGSLLGRCLVALGLPRGSKADADITLPAILDRAPASTQYEWAEVYLLNRGVGREEKDSFVVKEERDPAYREELAAFFRELGGGTVTVSEYAVILSAETARNLGFGRDGPYRAPA